MMSGPSGARKRPWAFLMCIFVLAVATLFGGAAPAVAAPTPAPARAPSPCTTEQWRAPSSWDECVGKLADLAGERASCVKAPTPSAPDSGMAGWFASTPSEELRASPHANLYTTYGYAGYDY